MRLLNTTTLQVEEFLQSEVPEYVILSHFWQEEEVTLSDIQSGAASSKKGYSKLKNCAKQALEDGFAYCWIDTCCIDKTSSAELSEAINSMYQWYRDAKTCYAYLADFEIDPDDINGTSQSFAKSRWFTRGWTLQELIAPPVVEFYSKDWVEFGTRLSLQDRLAGITRITRDVLCGGNLSKCGVGVKMSWAANRRTSRVEDEAYCLMGLFSVNMPLLYGEGTRAFRRLQEEILRVEEDYTLFAWSPKRNLFSRESSKGLFAKSPQDFSRFTLKAGPGLESLDETIPIWQHECMHRNCFHTLRPPIDYAPPHLTSRGLRIMLPLVKYGPEEYYLCLTSAQQYRVESYLVCITLKCLTTRNQEKQYIRNGKSEFLVLPSAMKKHFKYTSIYVDQPSIELERLSRNRSSWTFSPMPSFLLVKMGPALVQHLSVNFSILVSLQSLLEASHSRNEKALASRHWTYYETLRLQEVAKKLSSMSYNELKSLGMSDVAKWYLLGSSSAHNIVGFIFDNANEGFWVHIDLKGSPTCKIILRDSKQLEEDIQTSMEHLDWGLMERTDRTTVLLNRTATNEAQNSALPPLKINVSVRRIASACGAAAHLRYVLSLSLPNESLTLPFHPVDSTVGRTDS